MIQAKLTENYRLCLDRTVLPAAGTPPVAWAWWVVDAQDAVICPVSHLCYAELNDEYLEQAYEGAIRCLGEEANEAVSFGDLNWGGGDRE